MDALTVLARLGLALAIGLLLGLERGWSTRERPEGSRPAGLRTFGLIALLGATAEHFGSAALFVSVLAAVAALLVVGQIAAMRRTDDIGLTTEMAALLAFLLGALVMRGHADVAAPVAVVVAGLLALKQRLHGWIARLAPAEIEAFLLLLLLSLVLLPALPDRSFDPWGALNPRDLWLMVVLVAGVSFVGYVAVRIAGPRAGLLLAALAGGLVSSTAVTVSYARLAVKQPALRPVLGGGVLLATLVQFPRVLLVLAAVHPPLAFALLVPFGAMATTALVLVAVELLRARGARQPPPTSDLALGNPVELGRALQFGGLLAVITLAAHVLRSGLGEQALLPLALVSGTVDVDAISLSFAGLSSGGMLGVEAAARLVTTAVVVNTLTKGLFALAVERGRWSGGLLLRLAAVGAVGTLASLR